MTRILSTKKLQAGPKQFLLNAGFSVVEADFIRVTTVPFELQQVADNLIVTSQNGVMALAGHPKVQGVRRKPVFCVGSKTADLLDQHGFTVQEIAGSAQKLAQVIVSGYAGETFTFFSGNIRRDELPVALLEANVQLNEIEVYRTEPTPQRVGVFDGILFFSPSGVQSFMMLNQIGDEMCFCIGATTANELEKTTHNIIIANQPSVENTIIQAINHFKKA